MKETSERFKQVLAVNLIHNSKRTDVEICFKFKYKTLMNKNAFDGLTGGKPDSAGYWIVPNNCRCATSKYLFITATSFFLFSLKGKEK